MTEFGRTPFFTARRIRGHGLQDGDLAGQLLRVANKAQAELYAAIRRDGGTQNMVDRMQTRAELYATIGYHDYEALDASDRARPVIPQAMPQRRRDSAASVYIGSEIYRHSSYGPKHPLAVPRVSTCTDLCRALGWLPDDGLSSTRRWRPSRN